MWHLLTEVRNNDVVVKVPAYQKAICRFSRSMTKKLEDTKMS